MYSLVNKYIENLCMLYGTYIYNIKNPEFIKINTGYFTKMWKEELNMNEEEKKAIEWLKKADWFSARLYSSTILNLIEKQEKEIEYLKSQIPTDKIFYYSYKDFISKDKIKAKIGEYDKKKKDIPHEIDLKAFYTISDIRNIQIDVLKALLEED